MACTMLVKAQSDPRAETMTGRVVSMVVQPPMLMAAKGEKRAIRGERSSAYASRMRLLMSAIVPMSMKPAWLMRTEDSE